MAPAKGSGCLRAEGSLFGGLRRSTGPHVPQPWVHFFMDVFVIYVFHSHDVLGQELASFSIKGQIGNSFSFVGHTVSFAAIPLCLCSVTVATDIV